MSVGILLLTHAHAGDCILEAAGHIFTEAELPRALKVLSVQKNTKREELSRLIENLGRELNQGEGLLILTDLVGATPYNAACAMQCAYPVKVVAGLNLSMLLKVINYAHLDLDSLVEQAVEGGRRGVFSPE